MELEKGSFRGNERHSDVEDGDCCGFIDLNGRLIEEYS